MDDKGYELTFESLPTCLHAVISCDRFDLDIATLYLKEVTDKLGELGVTRLLLERRV